MKERRMFFFKELLIRYFYIKGGQERINDNKWLYNQRGKVSDIWYQITLVEEKNFGETNMNPCVYRSVYFVGFRMHNLRTLEVVWSVKIRLWGYRYEI